MGILSLAPGGSAWTFGASILTFAFPMILFIAVAGALWVLYTKPELVPGRPVGDAERPVSYTPMPHQPAVGAGQAAPAGDGAGAPEEGAAVAAADGAGQAVTAEDKAATPEAATPEDSAAAGPEDSTPAATGDGE